MKMICARCKKSISLTEDKWVHIEDWDCNKKVSGVNVHLRCWKVQHKEAIQKAFNEKAKSISPMLQKMVEKIGGLTKND